jgi:hypothetical protein
MMIPACVLCYSRIRNAIRQTAKVTAVERHLPHLIRDPYKNATARKLLITICVSLRQRSGTPV